MGDRGPQRQSSLLNSCSFSASDTPHKLSFPSPRDSQLSVLPCRLAFHLPASPPLPSRGAARDFKENTGPHDNAGTSGPFKDTGPRSGRELEIERGGTTPQI